MTSNNKSRKITRAKADELLGKVRKNILDCNSNPYRTFCIRRAVVFGSYVNNPEMEKISDIDIGLDFDYRYRDNEIREYCFENDFEFLSLGWTEEHICRAMNSFDGLGMYIEVQKNFIRGITGGSHYVSVHRIGTEDDDAIFSKKILEIAVGDIASDADALKELMEIDRQNEEAAE